MTNNELKKIIDSLKTDVDFASIWMNLAEKGATAGAVQDTDSSPIRKFIVNELKNYREKIFSKCNQFLAEIDRCIEKMS